MSTRDTTQQKQAGRHSRSGFTLIEIMVAMLLATVSSAGIIQGIVVAKGLNQSSEQRVVAFSMARAQMEEVKGRDYQTLMAGTSVENGLGLTHLGGATQTALTCSRWTFVLNHSSPPRKEVWVMVRWTYRGRQMNELIRGVMYEK